MAEKTFLYRIGTQGAKRSEKDLKAVDRATKGVAASSLKAGKAASFMRIKTKGLRRTLGAIRNQLLVLAFAFGGLIHAMNKSIQAYKKQWQAEQQLIAGLKNVAGYSMQATKELIRYAGALQQVTTFSDENTISGMAMLATFQLNAATIKEITPRMLDMAAAVQIAGGEEQELKSIAIALGKGLTGQVGMLTRYGIVIDKMGLATARSKGKTAEFNFILKQLDQNFKDIAWQLATSTIGEITRYEMAIGDSAERIGKAILPLKLWYSQFKLGAIGLFSTLAIMKDMNLTWKEARKELKGLSEIDVFDLGAFRLPPALAIELATLNKEFAYSLVLAQQRALIDDGIIDQQEQLGLLDLQRIHLNNLKNQGLFEEIDYWTQITQLNNQMTVLYKQLAPHQQMQIDMIRQFGSAMAQAAIDGQNMGEAVTSAIRAIAAQILAELAVFILAKALGLDLSLLMTGGTTITKVIGGLLGIGKSVVAPAAFPAVPTQTALPITQIYAPITIIGDPGDASLLILEDGLNRIRANA